MRKRIRCKEKDYEEDGREKDENNKHGKEIMNNKKQNKDEKRKNRM